MSYQVASWVLDIAKLFVGPLAGAFAGAMTAQGIAKRNARTQRQLEELRATNTAVSAARATVATAAALKHQHVLAMKQAYEKLSADRIVALNGGKGRFHYSADLQTLPPFRTAVPLLEKLLYERISPHSGVLGLFGIVVQSVGGICDAIESRNSIIGSIKGGSAINEREFADIYFGLENKDGHTDRSFPDSLDALVHNLDCTILYGCVLAQELANHAKMLAGKNKEFPQAEVAKFGALSKAGLIPQMGPDDLDAFKALDIVPEISTTD